MVNNFKLIANYIDSFETNEDMFFYVSVIVRHKDVDWFPNRKNNDDRTIFSVYIGSSKELFEYENIITALCDSIKARAYINIVPKSYFEAASLTLEHVTKTYIAKNYKGIKNSWSKGVGNSSLKEYKLFLVDIDEHDKHRVDEIKNYINNQIRPIGDKVVIQVPSRTGIHLLCKKFDTLEFRKQFKGIDIHKNGLTILYSF